MKKNNSIGDAILSIQNENDRLKKIEKIFDKAIKSEFGYDLKNLHKIVEKYNEEKIKNNSLSLINQLKPPTHSDTYIESGDR